MQENNNKKGSYWPWLLVGLLVSGSSFNLYMVHRALSDPSFAVEKNYYKKALQWDQTMAQKRTNAKLGWAIKANVKPHLKKNKASIKVHAKVVDKSGQVVKDAHVSFEAFHNARSARRFNKDMRRYNDSHNTTIPTYRQGIWVFQYTVLRGKQRFTQTLRTEL